MSKQSDNLLQPSIYKMIDDGRWRRALFTSFTLSLTYFESYLLPRLRSAGCETIDIYADALGHRDSLIERHSTGAGRDYTPVPVTFSGGIFHPKLIHLEAENGDADLLIVSSGNLTYAGHGGGIEVVEVLRADLHAAAFTEAAAFFNDLLNDERFDTGNRDGMRATETRLAYLGGKYPNVENVHFVHSLHESGLEQLARAVQGTRIDEILVLSPYHDEQGAPVRELLQRTGAAVLLAGIEPRADTSPFPFDIAAHWGVEVRPVQPDVEKRSLHAKWYELRGPDGVLAFTGSFNATITSLTTTRNVECGVLRALPQPSGGWIDAKTPGFARQEFPREGTAGAALTASASLTAGRLSGRILAAPRGVAGLWNLTLSTALDPEIVVPGVEVDGEGRFSAVLAAPPSLHRTTALQFLLERDRQSARGWVALPDMLRLPPHARSVLALTRNFAHGGETAAEVNEVLSLLLNETMHLMGDISNAPAARVTPPGARGRQEASEEVALTAEQYRAAAAQTHAAAHAGLLGALAAGQHGWGMLRHLVDILAGYPEEPPEPGARRPPVALRPVEDDADGKEDVAGDAADKRNKQIEKQIETALRKLEQWQLAMGKQRDALAARYQDHEDAYHPSLDVVHMGLAWIDLTLLHGSVCALGGVIKDPEAAFNYAVDWMRRVAVQPRHDAARKALVTDVAGVSAALALRCVQTGERLWPAITENRPGAQHARVIQFLEYFYGGEPDRTEVLEHAQVWLQTRSGAVLTDGAADDALEALNVMLDTPTPRAVVRRVLEATAEQAVAAVSDRDAALTLSPGALEILREAATRGRSGFVAVDFRNLRVCWNRRCHHSFLRRVHKVGMRPLDELVRNLRVFSVARCPHCHIPLISNDAAKGLQP